VAASALAGDYFNWRVRCPETACRLNPLTFPLT